MYSIKHTTRTARAKVRDVKYRLDINTLHRDETASGLTTNEIGRVTLRTTPRLFAAESRRTPTTGPSTLVDEDTNPTVGAGMVLGEAQQV